MNAHNPTECRAVEDLLVTLSAGELETELALQLRAHLEVCAHCSEAFAGIARAQQLAAELKLSSPELDRYPEFLRRLAASEAQAAKVADWVAEPVRSGNQIVSLVPIASEKELATSATSQAGAAAIIPLFGNRLVFRSGFGRGFDLQITSSQNRELFHLSANSLTKAAAIVAGVSVFAASTLIAFGFIVIFLFRQWQSAGEQTAVQRVNPQEQVSDPRHAPPIPQNFPWLQTVAGDRSALALWKAGSQVQAGFIEGQGASISHSFTLLTPAHTQNRPLVEPRMTDCTIASDGQNFVTVREQSGSLFVWELKPQASKQHSPVSEQPIVISHKGVQPAIAWAGDRYLVVWIEPDPNLPKIKMIELGKDGRPLQFLAMTVAETDRANEKLGTPSIAAQAGKAIIVYQKQGGVLLAKLWDSVNGLRDSQFELLRQKGWMINRPILSVARDGYFLCLGENQPEGGELRVASISFAGEVQKTQTFAVARTQILTFDFRASGEEMALIWSEAEVGGAQIFAQRFSLEGIASTRVVNLTPPGIAPLAFAFADAEGKAMIWHEARPAEKQFPVATRRIGWSR